MCTVTVIPIDGGVRLACNRDEHRTRPAALPPALERIGDHRVLYPLDPFGGGTWIAISDVGISLALLNRNASSPSIVGDRREVHRLGNPRFSRGRVIPALLDATTLDEMVARALALTASDFRPFRLVLLDRQRFVELISTGREILPARHAALAEPILLTSSGLGDSAVEKPRGVLFQNFFAKVTSWTSARQDAFHRHQWPSHPHLSVCMRREEAQTVSFTTVELQREWAQMNYRSAAPDQPASETSLSLVVTKPTKRRRLVTP